MHLTFRQIRYFVEIVEAGSMTRAAEHLRLAPTALSLQVRTMEEHFGVPLLERHSRGVRPTEAGQELIQRGAQILDLLEETERAVSLREPKNRRFHLGVPASALRVVGTNAVREGHLSDNQEVELVEGFSSNLISRLERGDLDMTLAFEVEPSDSRFAMDLLEECLVFATRYDPAIGEAATIGFREALGSDLVIFGDDDQCWKVVQASATEAGLDARVAHRVGSVDMIRHMISEGLGSAILPFGIIEEEWRRNDVSVYAIEGEPAKRRMSMVWRDAEIWSPDMDCFVQYVDGFVSHFHSATAPFTRMLSRSLPRSIEKLNTPH